MGSKELGECNNIQVKKLIENHHADYHPGALGLMCWNHPQEG